MRILIDNRWIGSHGIGRFASEVIKRLGDVQTLDDKLSPINPFDFIWSSIKISRSNPLPQVYFTPGYTPPLWSPVPFVFTICDLNHIDLPQYSNVLKRAYYRFVMHPACHRAFRVLTISEFSRKRILEWSGLPSKRVVNVSLGVDDAFQPEGPVYEPGFPYLLHIGNHKPHKNIECLLNAFRLSCGTDRIKLILSGIPDPSIVALIRQWNLENHVIFSGLILDSNLPDVYRGAKALVFPSLYEGFGLPVLEAMACGTPVIASNTTALPEVIGEAGVLVDPYDVNDIAFAIEKLVSGTQLQSELSQKGLEQAKKFSWDRTANRVWHVLQEAAR
jgi:glycosyltransferase involved in cell wall biosynthesis